MFLCSVCFRFSVCFDALSVYSAALSSVVVVSFGSAPLGTLSLFSDDVLIFSWVCQNFFVFSLSWMCFSKLQGTFIHHNFFCV